VLVLTSPRGGNMISNQFFDDSLVERVVIVPEALGAGSVLPPHHVIFNAIGDPTRRGAPSNGRRPSLRPRRPR